ncbi:MAG: hypothetical protein AABX72_02765 [Nanoarchaeota archaeon]
MKKIVSIIPIIAIIAVISFALPSQTYAAWWNPFSWFSQNKQIEEQGQPQTTNQNIEATENQNTVAPLNNTPSSDAKTIEALKADIVLLTNGMSELLKAHNNLVNEHNALVKSVNAISSNKNVGATTNNSALDGRVTDLENKLNNVCRKIFSSLGGFGGNCPSTAFSVKGTLEGRVEKLESGF